MEQECNTRRFTGSNIVCLEGNGYRPSHFGDGYKVSGIMYTLNSVEVHCVAYETESDIYQLGTSSE